MNEGKSPDGEMPGESILPEQDPQMTGRVQMG